MRILKLLHIYIFCGIDYLVFGQCSLFLPGKVEKYRKRTYALNRFRYFFLPSTNIKKILYTWRTTCKYRWFYQPNLAGIWGNTASKMEKLDKYFTLYHIPFIVKEFQYTFFTFPNKECMTSLIKKQIFFIRPLLENKCC